MTGFELLGRAELDALQAFFWHALTEDETWSGVKINAPLDILIRLLQVELEKRVKAENYR